MTGGFSVRKQIESNIREVVFGLEDSLVSTLGAITGIAAGTGDGFVVILSGIVLIFVEALSMSAGSYLSSKSASEVFEKTRRQDASRALQESVSDDETLQAFFDRKGLSEKDTDLVLSVIHRERTRFLNEVQGVEYHFIPSGGPAVTAAVFMGFFYLFGGVFPILPYFFLPVGSAVIPSIVLTGLMLFALGSAKAKIAGTSWIKSGFEMTTISLTAAVLGFLIGRIVSSFFGVTVV